MSSAEDPDGTSLVAAPAPRRSMMRNVGALLASQVTTWALSSLLLVLQPRLLDPADLGDLRLAVALWAIVVVFNGWGTGTMMRIEVAQDHDQAWPLVAAVTRLRGVLMLIMAPVVAVFCFVAGYSGRQSLIIAILGVGVLLAIFGQTRRDALVGLEQMPTIGRYDVLNEVVLVVVLVSVLLLGANAIGIATATSALVVFANVLFGRGLRKQQPPSTSPPRFRGRALIRAATKYLLVDATIVIYLQVDTVIISLLVGATELGYYTTADTLFGSLLFVPTVVMTALFPSFARMHEHTPDESRALMERIFRLLLVFGVWIGIGTIVVSHSLTLLLFGSKFAKAGPVLAVFGVVTTLSYLSMLLGAFSVASGRAGVWTKFMVISIVASVPLDLVLVRFADHRYGNGAIGGALAYIVTELFQVVGGVIVLAPTLISRRTFARLGRLTLAGGALFAVGWPLRHRFVLYPGVLGSLAFMVVLVAVGTFDRSERDLLWGAVRNVRNRRSGGND